jgi:HK97 family phage major capsid protein
MRRDDYVALVEQRREAYGEAHALNKKAEREARNFTADEQRQWDEYVRRMEMLGAEIEQMRADASADYRPSADDTPAGFRSASRFDGEIETAIGSIAKGESRALSTAVSISPGELSNTLFDRLRAASVVLKTGIKTLNIEADSVTYPTLTADAAPAWTSEAAAITPSDPTLSTVVATPRKLAALRRSRTRSSTTRTRRFATC